MLRTIAPSAPSVCATVTDMPSATPACGSSVMPSHFCTPGGHFINFALMLAPAHLPNERARIYAAPISTTEVLLNTFNSSFAPLSTKNRIYSGAVQRSVDVYKRQQSKR